MTNTVKSVASLKSLLVPSKEVEADFPGFPGFKVKLSFLARETLVNIRKKATKVSFKSRQGMVEELNDDAFLEMYVQHAIKGWSGLKIAYLELLAPIDISGQDLEAELEYSAENALFLMKNSKEFDSWVSEQVGDLGNFQTSSAKK
ncbi:hypothetical protein UFOVP273_142 [uncultured Caudovirales phage]|uniref:Tail assembly chaperone n=1 Tax=uncultured Caudovirales phage TaxID=2100421 RepID=A0A6J5LME4_9CAUD|nr:hypothetical protein UFOVP273_142 [uncultured Caudovirales phage]